MVVRACGERIVGGVYLTLPLGPNGRPVDDFIICQPKPVDLESMGLSAIGTKILPRTIVDPLTGDEIRTHFVFDVVGASDYPNVTDFIEEVRRFGLSRRIARNSDFSLLDSNSRLILIHERAFIENAHLYHEARDEDRFWCPRDMREHVKTDYRDMCASLWWEDVSAGDLNALTAYPDEVLTYGKKISTDQPGVMLHIQRHNKRAVVRTLPSLRYRGLRAPDGVTPQYRDAVFASFPIPRIEVVRDPAGGSHVEALERARKSGIEVEEVNE